MPPDDDRFLELTVADVRREAEGSAPMRRHVTILRERDGARVLPIWMGPAEAAQIALALAACRPVTVAAALLAEAQPHTELAALEAAHPEDAGRITADALALIRRSIEEFEAERCR